MKGPEQPERLKLSSAQSPALRSLLQAAEHDGATSDQLARLKARLPPGTAGGPGHAGPSGSPLSAATAASPLPWKATAAIIVAAALAGGGWAVLSGRASPEVPAAAPIVSCSAAESSAPPEVLTPSTPQALVMTQPSASVTIVAASARPIAVQPPTASSQPSETALLDEARRVMSDHPGRALALLRRHRQLYPDGMLAQEREVLMVDALTRLGRSTEAQQQADQFRSAHPGSVYGDRVEKTVQSASPVDSSGTP